MSLTDDLRRFGFFCKQCQNNLCNPDEGFCDSCILNELEFDVIDFDELPLALIRLQEKFGEVVKK